MIRWMAAVFFCIAALWAAHELRFYFYRRKNKERIEQLTGYLEKVNLGKDVSILPGREDAFSILEDEIYKTVTELVTAKEDALKAQRNFADSLADIAHQIKTPLTTLSVSVQMLEDKLTQEENRKLQKQLERADKLVCELLTLAKIDAGALELKRERVDVYTLLMLASEALEDLIKKKHAEIFLPNYPEVFYIGDLDWSVEIFINLLKNSLEHMPENGAVFFSYEKNPLYVEISMRDNGEGFDEGELPFLFQRFYQGGRRKTGTGIGLSMAKSLIEMQNGFITAKNCEEGGAKFTIRFYCH